MSLPRGRVLPAPPRAESADDKITPAVVQRRWHVISREALLAQEQADAIVARAHDDAKHLLAEAEDEAAETRRRAEDEGRAAAVADLAAGWLRLRAAEAQQTRASEEQVIAIARILAERILGHALTVEPTVIVGIAREILANVVRARRVVLTAHPADAAVLQSHVAELGLDAAVIDVQGDDTRQRGSLRAETDLGMLETELALQLDRLLEALRRNP